MAKRGEVSLRASERLKDFDENRFAVGDWVAFKSNGVWQMGQLVDVPGKKPVERTAKNVMVQAQVLDAGGGFVTNEFTTNVAPKKIKYTTTAPLPGASRYHIISTQVGPNGEIWHDLEDNGPPPKILRNVDEEMMSSAELVSQLDTRIGGEVVRLTGEIKKIAGGKSAELMKQLTDIKSKVEDVSLLFGKIETWNKADADEMEFLAARTKTLEKEIDKALRDLEKSIQSKITAERKAADPESDAGKGRAAINLENRFNDKLKTADDLESSRFKTEHDDWETRNTKYQDWRKKLADTEARLAEAKKPAGGGGKKGGGGGPPADPVLVANLTAEVGVLRGAPETDPGTEPVLKLPSASEDEKKNIMLDLFEEMEYGYGSLPREMQILQDEFIKKRGEKATKEGVGVDYSSGDPTFGSLTKAERDALTPADRKVLETDYKTFLNYRNNTVEIMNQVKDEWKAKAGPEVGKFDFAEEKKQLQEKLDELRPRAVATHVEGDVDNLDVLVKGLQKNDPNVSQNIINLWEDLGDLEVEIFRAEKAPKMAPREAKLEFVDLPRSVTAELLHLNPALIREAMREAFRSATEPGAVSTGVRSHLESFINSIDDAHLGDDLRAALAQHGIKDWDTFKDKWKNQLADRFSNVLIEMADSELRNMVAQTLNDIRGGSRWYDLPAKVRDAVSDIWNYSAVGNMKGTMALRMLINTGVLVTVGGTSEILLALAGVQANVRGAVVGGVVGLAKAGLQRFMGRSDEAHFQRRAKEAQAEGERKKKNFISDTLIRRMFDETTDPATGIITVSLRPEAEQNMASQFSSGLGEVTRERIPEEQKLVITDPDNPSVQITLEGDAICAYYEGLKRTAEDQEEDTNLVGDEKEEARTKFKFAKGIYLMRQNSAPNLNETPPLAVRATKWIMDTYSGRIAGQPGSKKADILTRGKPDEGQVEEEKVDFARQAAGTVILGAGIGEMMVLAGKEGAAKAGTEAAKNFVLNGDVISTTIGAVSGFTAGEQAGYKAERSQADRESRTFLENLSTGLEGRLAELTRNVIGGATEPDDAFHARRIERAQSVAQLDMVLALLLEGKPLNEVPMDLMDVSLGAPPGLGRDARFFTAHNLDLASILQRDKKLRNLVSGMRREISRSGELEVLKFVDRLKRLEVAQDQVQKNADKQVKNALGVELWRGIKRHARGVAYAGVGALASYGLRHTARAVTHGILGDKNLSEFLFNDDKKTTTETEVGEQPATDAAKAAGAAVVGAKAGEALQGHDEAVKGGADATEQPTQGDKTAGAGAKAIEATPEVPKSTVHSPDAATVDKAATIEGGEGPEHQIERQLRRLIDANKDDPKALAKLGFKENVKEAYDQVGGKAERIAIQNGLYDATTGKTTGGITGGKLFLKFDENTGEYKTEFSADTKTITMVIPRQHETPADVKHEESPKQRVEETSSKADRYSTQRKELADQYVRETNEKDTTAEALEEKYGHGLKVSKVPENLPADQKQAAQEIIDNLRHRHDRAIGEYNAADVSNRQEGLEGQARLDLADVYAGLGQLNRIIHDQSWSDLGHLRNSLTGVSEKATAAIPAETPVSDIRAAVVSSTERGSGGGGTRHLEQPAKATTTVTETARTPATTTLKSAVKEAGSSGGGESVKSMPKINEQPEGTESGDDMLGGKDKDVEAKAAAAPATPAVEKTTVTELSPISSEEQVKEILAAGPIDSMDKIGMVIREALKNPSVLGADIPKAMGGSAGEALTAALGKISAGIYQFNDDPYLQEILASNPTDLKGTLSELGIYFGLNHEQQMLFENSNGTAVLDHGDGTSFNLDITTVPEGGHGLVVGSGEGATFYAPKGYNFITDENGELTFFTDKTPNEFFRAKLEMGPNGNMALQYDSRILDGSGHTKIMGVDLKTGVVFEQTAAAAANAKGNVVPPVADVAASRTASKAADTEIPRAKPAVANVAETSNKAGAPVARNENVAGDVNEETDEEMKHDIKEAQIKTGGSAAAKIESAFADLDNTIKDFGSVFVGNATEGIVRMREMLVPGNVHEISLNGVDYKLSPEMDKILFKYGNLTGEATKDNFSELVHLQKLLENPGKLVTDVGAKSELESVIKVLSPKEVGAGGEAVYPFGHGEEDRINLFRSLIDNNKLTGVDMDEARKLNDDFMEKFTSQWQSGGREAEIKGLLEEIKTFLAKHPQST